MSETSWKHTRWKAREKSRRTMKMRYLPYTFLANLFYEGVSEDVRNNCRVGFDRQWFLVKWKVHDIGDRGSEINLDFLTLVNFDVFDLFLLLLHNLMILIIGRRQRTAMVPWKSRTTPYTFLVVVVYDGRSEDVATNGRAEFNSQWFLAKRKVHEMELPGLLADIEDCVFMVVSDVEDFGGVSTCNQEAKLYYMFW